MSIEKEKIADGCIAAHLNAAQLPEGDFYRALLGTDAEWICSVATCNAVGELTVSASSETPVEARLIEGICTYPDLR